MLLLLLCVACVSDMLLTFCSITFVAAVAVALAAAVVVAVCNVEIVAKLQIFSQRLRSLTPAPTHCCRRVVVAVVLLLLLLSCCCCCCCFAFDALGMP